MADVLIKNAEILTMDSARRIIDRGWISVSGNRIEDIGDGDPDAVGATKEIDARGGLVMPGFVSSHAHPVDAMLRGGIEVDRNLFDWFYNIYYGGLAAFTPEDCNMSIRLAMAEGIRGGITTFQDTWGINTGDDAARVDACAEASIEAYRSVGMRCIFSWMFNDRIPAAWDEYLKSIARKIPTLRLDPATIVEDTDSVLARMEALMRKHHGSDGGRIHACPAPCLPNTCTEEALLGSLELAREFDTLVTIHVNEQMTDAKMFSELWQISATEWMHNMGFLDPRVVAAHCVWLSDKDIRLFRMHDVKVAHNPTSNHFLGSGAAPIDKMVMAGITVGLGTDDVNLHSNVSIFSEMRRAALLQKVVCHDAGVITAEKVLEMATIDGARVLGLDSEIGSLEVGKKADVIILDTDAPHWFPRHHLPSVLVFQAHDEDVRTVLIDGRVVMEDRALHFFDDDDEQAFLARVQKATERIVEEAGLQSARDRGWQSFSRV